MFWHLPFYIHCESSPGVANMMGRTTTPVFIGHFTVGIALIQNDEPRRDE
jgi:hypothetical protein